MVCRRSQWDHELRQTWHISSFSCQLSIQQAPIMELAPEKIMAPIAMIQPQIRKPICRIEWYQKKDRQATKVVNSSRQTTARKPKSTQETNFYSECGSRKPSPSPTPITQNGDSTAIPKSQGIVPLPPQQKAPLKPLQLIYPKPLEGRTTEPPLETKPIRIPPTSSANY